MRVFAAASLLFTMLSGIGVAAEHVRFDPDLDADRIGWTTLESRFGPRPELKGLRFGIVLKTFENEYWRQMAAGYRRRAALDGVKLDIQAAQNESDPVRQFAVMENMIGGFYAALLISPQSSTNMQPAIDDADNANLPIVDVDGAVVDSVRHFVGPSNRKIGEQVADWFVHRFPKGGKVAVVKGQPGVYSTINRTSGFVDRLAKAGTFALVATVTADWDRQKAYNAAVAILKESPDLIGIYCNNDTMALGVADAVKDMHRLGDVHVFGTDGTTRAYDYIRTGDLDGTVDIFPIIISDVGLEVGERLAVRQSLPRVVETPSALVTRDNADRYTGSFDTVSKALAKDVTP